MRHKTIFINFLFISMCIFCSRQKEKTVLPAEITLDFSAERGDEGQVFIVGTTNLPDGVKLGAEVTLESKQCCQDFDIFVSGGRFHSTGFTDHKVPIPPGKYKVCVLTYFNEFWQSSDILKIVGKGGANLKGKILELEDPDVVDSDKIIKTTNIVQFPPLTGELKAITLVKRAILIVDGNRSATDIEANIELFMKNPGLRPAAGWSAKLDSGMKYTVSYSYTNGEVGEQEAIWEADIATKKVRYVNKNAKYFSWTPNY